MTDLERFTRAMAKMMGKCYPHDYQTDWAEEECAKCGIPYFNAEFFEPIVEGELTPECRKWLAENLPEAWEEYCDFIYCDIDFTNIRTFYSEVLAAQLSAENLWKWMRENTDSWLYRKCTTCNGSGLWYRGGDKEFCISCNGTGRVARWDVEKWLEGK